MARGRQVEELGHVAGFGHDIPRPYIMGVVPRDVLSGTAYLIPWMVWDNLNVQPFYLDYLGMFDPTNSN